jgi:hypothetical protein
MAHASVDELIPALAALASTQNLRGRAYEGCGEWLRDGSGDDLGGWSAEEIEPHFRSCSLVFDHGFLDYPFVSTLLELCIPDTSGVCFRNLRVIGSYRLITRLDGTVDDDYFVIDVPKATGA